MISWPQLLMSIAEAWRDRREELMNSAYEILGSLRRVSVVELSREDISHDLTDAAFRALDRSFDERDGGWGRAPKFPQAMSMDFLLKYWKRTGNERALGMVRHTAEKMARGGIYDQLGGGFHRYSVDAVWLVPHFEKMLYDNAQLLELYLDAWLVSGNQQFADVARDILRYVLRDMTHPGGGFYSAEDADSEGVEGKFYTWTPAQLAAVLGESLNPHRVPCYRHGGGQTARAISRVSRASTAV